MTNEELDRMTGGACIQWDGKICRSSAFVSRMNFKDSKYKPTETELKRISNLPLVDIARIDDIEDSNVHEWYQIGAEKYGRFMYCPKTDTKRGQTMGEFYGNSTVD